MGSIQASQAITMLLGKGEPLIGRLLLFNALDMKFKELKLRKNPHCPICGPNPTIKELIDYEAFCGVEEELSPELEVSVQTLKKLLDEKKNVTIVDVREPFEWEIAHIASAKLIPLAQLPERVNELDTADQLILQCHTGQRSAQATKFLHGLGFKKARNLKGGIEAWAREIDLSMQTY
jgi:adenylyltransferase/sulfurtransferase